MLRPLASLSLRGSRAITGTVARRCLATDAASPLVTVEASGQAGVSLVKLARPPVNSLNTKLLTDLREAIKGLEADKSVRAAVLTAAQGSVFSAGIDIMELYQREPQQMRTFWNALQDAWIALYGSCECA